MSVKKYITFLFLVFLVNYCKGQWQWGQPYSGQCVSELVSPAFTKSCNSNPWVLEFEDNFDGNQIDLSKWDVKESVVRGFSNPTAWMSPNNVEVSNGTLKLIATQNTPPLQGTYVTDWSTNPLTTQTNSFDHSVGEVWPKQSLGYGKDEIRAKVPSSKGVLPAIWTDGSIGCNEIDVFEKYTDELTNYPTNIHYYPNTQTQGSNACQHTIENGPNYSVAFHTFTMIWDFFKVEWYIDGDLVRQAFKFHTLLGQSIDCNSFSPFTQYVYNKAFPIEDMNIILGQ